MKIGRLTVRLIRRHFGSRLFVHSSLRPEFIGNGWQRASGEFVPEAGGFWVSTLILGRLELFVTWAVDRDPSRPAVGRASGTEACLLSEIRHEAENRPSAQSVDASTASGLGVRP